jgi:excinuclease ABC subunit C
MVYFQDGKPNKDGYRHFKIKTVAGADDYGMMKEVLLRRYQKAMAENDLPDLVLVDGGRGQLNVAREVFQELKIQDVDLLSLAKERIGEGPGPFEKKKTEEKIFHPRFPEPFILERHSPLLNFLDRIRDEAHRFAITYHKKIRGKGTIQSLLGEIPEIGAVRQKELLEFFGTVEKIGTANVDELTRVPGINRKAAQAVYQFFHRT